MNAHWAFWSLRGLLTICVSIAVITDLRTGKIYNIVTLPAIALGLMLNALAHGWHGVWISLAGLGIAVLALPLLMTGLGAGRSQTAGCSRRSRRSDLFTLGTTWNCCGWAIFRAVCRRTTWRFAHCLA